MELPKTSGLVRGGPGGGASAPAAGGSAAADQHAPLANGAALPPAGSTSISSPSWQTAASRHVYDLYRRDRLVMSTFPLDCAEERAQRLQHNDRHLLCGSLLFYKGLRHAASGGTQLPNTIARIHPNYRNTLLGSLHDMEAVWQTHERLDRQQRQRPQQSHRTVGQLTETPGVGPSSETDVNEDADYETAATAAVPAAVAAAQMTTDSAAEAPPAPPEKQQQQGDSGVCGREYATAAGSCAAGGKGSRPAAAPLAAESFVYFSNCDIHDGECGHA